MTPIENPVNRYVRINENLSGVRAASTFNVLAGIWLFISPWVYGAYTSANAWNSWIVGAIIIILAATRAGNPAMQTWMSWINCLLGIWAFASPWIYGYAGDDGRFISNLCVGVVVFVLAITSASASPQPTERIPSRL